MSYLCERQVSGLEPETSRPLFALSCCMWFIKSHFLLFPGALPTELYLPIRSVGLEPTRHMTKVFETSLYTYSSMTACGIGLIRSDAPARVKTPKIPQAHISYHRFCLVLPAIYSMFFFISLSHWGCWWDTIKFFPEHWLSEDDQLPESNRHNEKCSAKHFDTHWPYWPLIVKKQRSAFFTISQMVNGADGSWTRVQKYYLKILFTLLAW